MVQTIRIYSNTELLAHLWPGLGFKDLLPLLTYCNLPVQRIALQLEALLVEQEQCRAEQRQQLVQGQFTQAPAALLTCCRVADILQSRSERRRRRRRRRRRGTMCRWRSCNRQTSTLAPLHSASADNTGVKTAAMYNAQITARNFNCSMYALCNV